jgi:hypothetical protein
MAKVATKPKLTVAQRKTTPGPKPWSYQNNGFYQAVGNSTDNFLQYMEYKRFVQLYRLHDLFTYAEFKRIFKGV